MRTRPHRGVCRIDGPGVLDKKRRMIDVQSGELDVNLEEDGLIWMDQNKPLFGARLKSSVLSGCFDARHLDER